MGAMEQLGEPGLRRERSGDFPTAFAALLFLSAGGRIDGASVGGWSWEPDPGGWRR